MVTAVLVVLGLNGQALGIGSQPILRVFQSSLHSNPAPVPIQELFLTDEGSNCSPECIVSRSRQSSRNPVRWEIIRLLHPSRKTIDAQMDSWLYLGVIEPSESPWGFPVLIVYRNNKAWMCIGCRKLNAMTVPDECPLPKQSDIVQSLTGAQWLSTLDALSGFIQLESVEEDRPKMAFRTHCELQTFLGYIPFYAWIVAPLFALLKKEAKWNWGDMEQRAFELAKESRRTTSCPASTPPSVRVRLVPQSPRWRVGRNHPSALSPFHRW